MLVPLWRTSCGCLLKFVVTTPPFLRGWGGADTLAPWVGRGTLQAAMAPVQATFHSLLTQGAQRWAAPDRMCQELLDHEDALWTFVREEGVEPTNNAAEQALRPAVLWRKSCFGAQSATGNRFVERILSVRATCRQQERHLLTFVTEAIAAYWFDRPAPVLIAAPTTS